MYKRKKKPVKKARVSHTRRKAKRVVKRAVTKRRTPMAKKKSTDWDDEPVAAEEDVEGEEAEAAPEEEAAPEPTTTEASEDGVYVVDCPTEVAIKSQVYKKGDHVTLTPEELEAVQASGVRILPVT